MISLSEYGVALHLMVSAKKYTTKMLWWRRRDLCVFFYSQSPGNEHRKEIVFRLFRRALKKCSHLKKRTHFLCAYERKIYLICKVNHAGVVIRFVFFLATLQWRSKSRNNFWNNSFCFASMELPPWLCRLIGILQIFIFHLMDVWWCIPLLGINLSNY